MGLGGGQAGWNCQKSRGGRHEEDTAQDRGPQWTAGDRSGLQGTTVDRSGLQRCFVLILPPQHPSPFPVGAVCLSLWFSENRL